MFGNCTCSLGNPKCLRLLRAASARQWEGGWSYPCTTGDLLSVRGPSGPWLTQEKCQGRIEVRTKQVYSDRGKERDQGVSTAVKSAKNMHSSGHRPNHKLGVLWAVASWNFVSKERVVSKLCGAKFWLHLLVGRGPCCDFNDHHRSFLPLTVSLWSRPEVGAPVRGYGLLLPHVRTLACVH